MIGIALAVYEPVVEYLDAQLRSLERQTEVEWRCVVSDASSDERRAAAIEARVRGDSRYRYLASRGVRGVAANFEVALRALPDDCRFICFCDQDDEWEEGKLRRLRQSLEEGGSAALVHSDLTAIDQGGALLHRSVWLAEGRRIAEPTTYLDRFLRNQVTGCTVMMRRELVELMLPFPEGLGDAALHDQWGALLADASGPILAIDEPLVRYRQHGRNAIGVQPPHRWTKLPPFAKVRRLVADSQGTLVRAQSLARSLTQRLEERAHPSASWVRRELQPILEPHLATLVERLIRQRGRRPETDVALQLLVGWSTCRGER